MAAKVEKCHKTVNLVKIWPNHQAMQPNCNIGSIKPQYDPFGMILSGRNWEVGSGYRFGFNSYEIVNEITESFNSIDFGARIYNVQLGKFMSIDPRFAEYPWQSVYAYYSNNLISIVDIKGLGDYYTSDGSYLGSDGKTNTVTTSKGNNKKSIEVADDKAYVAESVVKGENGLVVSAENAVELKVSNSTLRKFANTVYNESSGNREESFGIASAIANMSEYKDRDILSSLENGGIVGFNGSTNYTNERYSMAAAINALQDGYDFSNGAIRWDGDDFGRKGANHDKPKFCGVEISAEHMNAYNAAYKTRFGVNVSSTIFAGVHLASSNAWNNKGRCLYESSAVHGRTIFWKPNDVNCIKYMPFILPEVGFDGLEYYPIYPNKDYRFDLNQL